MYLNPKEYQLKDMPVQCKDLVRINAVKRVSTTLLETQQLYSVTKAVLLESSPRVLFKSLKINGYIPEHINWIKLSFFHIHVTGPMRTNP